MKKPFFLLIVVAAGVLAFALLFFAGRGLGSSANPTLYDSDMLPAASVPAEAPVPPTAGGNVEVGAVILMRDASYEPSRVDITQGQIVKFVNDASVDRWPASNIHPTHEIYPEFDPKHPIPPGSSWSFQFDKIGEWRCHDHLSPNITCVITVR